MDLLRQQLVGSTDKRFYITNFQDSPSNLRSISINLQVPAVTAAYAETNDLETTPLLSLHGIYIHTKTKILIVSCKDKESFAIRKSAYDIQDVIERGGRNLIDTDDVEEGLHYLNLHQIPESIEKAPYKSSNERLYPSSVSKFNSELKYQCQFQ
ncbi:unnamed protein product [[Candida] boidinii]|uniref:Unnamed protein product n=1 Tax=Candida boidinii TaxID=5477 RepID=A0A9W6T5B4_CANBO|nr:unnamed protein product [[Candida] boidinii]GMF63523.1 unnamed protein product [[Candida] boidinii]